MDSEALRELERKVEAGEILRYRICHTLDPEERLEDAAMAKAMHDAFRLEIVSEGEADFGRDKRFSGLREQIAYWRDPAFLRRAGRSFELHDLPGAESCVSRLHKSGRGAFVKSCDLKLYTGRVPVGADLAETLGDMIWSVMDRPPCLMVQELCEVQWEQRFISVGRKIVTRSPVATHLTPIDRLPDGAQFRTPFTLRCTIAPEKDLSGLAQEVAAESEDDNVVIDCAWFNGKPAVVEFNPFSIGNFGLYNCDPAKIANALRALAEEG